jgi:hypothetical protein
MSIGESTTIALRLLEAVYLLLPVVAILLQTMISFYSGEGKAVSTVKQTTSLLVAFFGFVLLAISGLVIIGILFANGVDTILVVAAFISLFGLALFGVAVGLLVGDVLSEVE